MEGWPDAARVGIAIKETFEIGNAVITINRSDNGGSLEEQPGATDS